jgi:hypothetical protein
MLFADKSHGLHVGVWRRRTGSEKPSHKQRSPTTAEFITQFKRFQALTAVSSISQLRRTRASFKPCGRGHNLMQRPTSNSEDYRFTLFELGSPLPEFVPAAAGGDRVANLHLEHITLLVACGLTEQMAS